MGMGSRSFALISYIVRFRTTFLRAPLWTKPFPASVSHSNGTFGIQHPQHPQRGLASGSSEIIPLLVGQDLAG